MTREPLLLLPGMLSDRTMWHAQIEALSDITKVLVGDFGGSNSIDAMAAQILSRAPGRFALAGLSVPPGNHRRCRAFASNGETRCREQGDAPMARC